ncbi:MAG: dienelactone hydrolase family protein [Rhodanobacteraceae bacterium]|nr:dienelactone hydrolase family protein [Rhodanobacteraceae bacterium]
MTRPAWTSGGAEPGAASMAGNHSAPLLQAARIPAGRVHLDGDLSLPPAPRGLVVFAHGSGSSRHSVRNRYVAQVLNMHGLATLLLDLLTPAEDVGGAERFDIDLLSARLAAAVAWVRGHATLHALPIGLFGASTGAAAAIAVAAAHPGSIAAVVSRGGRPDLADDKSLRALGAPTLLIVGGDDIEVLRLNRAAQAQMHAPAEIAVIPGATHLFPEPGALERVADLAARWYQRWMRAA